ncbi:MAG: 5-bromo-4-chloroindolyl phosphate hydrolysis family protein [Blautia sp.]|nr:5-bromo-4-chloroindolyl phosphate hydrolysis family protein [Blautia sp.]
MGKKDFEDFGSFIEEIVDKAISSSDYQKLNETISKAIENAIDSGADALKSTLTGSGNSHNKEAYKNYRYTPPESFRKEKKKQEKKPELYIKSIGKKVQGYLLAAAGAVLAVGNGIGLLISGAMRSSFGNGVMSIFFLAGILLAVVGSKYVGKAERFQKYVSELGDRTYCDIEQLSRVARKPVKVVRKELKKMIDDRWFLEGHLDDQEKTLITSDAAYREYQEIQKQREEQKAQQAIENAKKPTLTPEVQDMIEKGREYVQEIRRCNDAIPGEEISRKISHMEEVVAKIFESAMLHPESAADLKKLMNYYLPMTIKLLNAYREMDSQPIQGETIQKSKKEIEDTLDTLNLAFEKLLDSVFHDTALDVSTDISVLQTLLAQEGLTEDEISSLHAQVLSGH